MAHVPALFHIKSAYPTLWSLSIEEQFYFFWPWIVKRNSLQNLFKVCLACCFIEPLCRGLNFLTNGSWTWLGLITSFDGFAFGAILALGFFAEKSSEDLASKGKVLLFLAGLLLVVLMPFGLFTRTRLAGEMFLPTTLYLLTGGFMAFCMIYSGHRKLAWLRGGVLPAWGKVSYGAYLCHYPVHEWVELGLRQFHFETQWTQSSLFCLGRSGLSILGTYLLSSVLFRTIEEPFLKLKEDLPQNAQLEKELQS